MPEKPKEKLLSLREKLAAIRAEAGAVKKTGHNDFHAYAYAEEAGALAKINPLLVKYRVGIITTVGQKNRISLSDGTMLTEVEMIYEVCDLDSPDSVKIAWWGEGADKKDKGLYKAYTGGSKYFLLKFFGLATGDDPENDAEEEREKSKHPKVQNDKKTKSPSGVELACPKCGLPGEYSHSDNIYGDVYVCVNPKCSFNKQRFNAAAEK